MQRPGNSFCSTRRPLYEAKLREYRDSQSSGPQVLENSEQAASEYAYKAVLTEMKAGACDMDWTALRNLISLRTRDPELFFELEAGGVEVTDDTAESVERLIVPKFINDNAEAAAACAVLPLILTRRERHSQRFLRRMRLNLILVGTIFPAATLAANGRSSTWRGLYRAADRAMPQRDRGRVAADRCGETTAPSYSVVARSLGGAAIGRGRPAGRLRNAVTWT